MTLLDYLIDSKILQPPVSGQFDISGGVPILMPPGSRQHLDAEPVYQDLWSQLELAPFPGLERFPIIHERLCPSVFYQAARSNVLPNSFLLKWQYHDAPRINKLVQLLRWALPDSQERAHLVADIGSGLGNEAAQLMLAFPNSKVVGVDIVLKGTVAAQAFHAQKYPDRLQFVCADATKLPFEDESFDAFYSVNAIEHAGLAMLEEISRILKPGGRGVIVGPSYHAFLVGRPRHMTRMLLDALGIREYHIHAVKNSEVRRILEKTDFRIVSRTTDNYFRFLQERRSGRALLEPSLWDKLPMRVTRLIFQAHQCAGWCFNQSKIFSGLNWMQYWRVEKNAY